jgi:hypothetical protein
MTGSPSDTQQNNDLIAAFGLLMPSTPFAYPQFASRRFAYFRVVKIRVSAGQCHLCAEFDSRQLH